MLLKKLISADVLAPAIVGLVVLIGWDLLVRVTGLPPYLLPGPLLVLSTLVENSGELLASLWVTFQIALFAFLAAAVSGLAIAVLFTLDRWIERSLYPYAVILQTTPLVAIAPLIIIWLKDNTFAALVLCAWIAAFFPVVANTTLGLNSVDRNLNNLFKLYNASPWQRLIYLRLPSALPYYLGGLRISGGLSLIGAVVAEFVAGSGGGGKSGIAYQILIASFNLQIPKMFAALLLVTLLGVAVFAALSALSHWLLKDWHESATRPEG
ncbi:MAG: ABC transporter permease subunit [Cyanobacteria bacterium]|nr:ABC transporter permease subunit [Cyanobacteriota bacterium]